MQCICWEIRAEGVFVVQHRKSELTWAAFELSSRREFRQLRRKTMQQGRGAWVLEELPAGSAETNAGDVLEYCRRSPGRQSGSGKVHAAAGGSVDREQV